MSTPIPQVLDMWWDDMLEYFDHADSIIQSRIDTQARLAGWKVKGKR